MKDVLSNCFVYATAHGTRGSAYLSGWTGDGALDVDDVLGICFGDAAVAGMQMCPKHLCSGGNRTLPLSFWA